MAIAVKLDELLHERRMTLTELAEKIDITLANLSILKTGKARAIRFSTLEAICERCAASLATCSSSSPIPAPPNRRAPPDQGDCHGRYRCICCRLDRQRATSHCFACTCCARSIC